MGSGGSTGLLVCAACGAGLPRSAKFCLECGAPVPSAAVRATRRTVTLLFTDVTGSTVMGEQLDAEAYRGVMGRYFDLARTAVERHGGTVEKFVGDAVLAVFGVPEVHEDDALRAVRAAYELNAAIAELSDRLVGELDVRLTIRTGVNTGAVVAGSARAGGSFATGDAVNTAARLEQAAPPGEILLGATTYALVRDAVEAEPTEPVVAKGKAEPLPAYRLLRVLDAVRGRRGREDLALVGRARENRTLDDAFARTATSRHSHQITILGPAGIGKSRLVGEFLGRVGDRAHVANGRCLSYGQGITYWPLVQALRSALHLSGTESHEITRHALNEALGHAPDRDELVEPLLALLGKAGIPGGTDQTFWSVRRLVEELASQRPLVLNVDDLHWAEPNLLELLQRMGEELTDLPLLLLCQARPELLEQHPEWGSQAVGSTTVVLSPLSSAETGASVAALLGGDPPEGVAATVADWSGGNPLFIEEIVAHLAESGALEREPEGRWRVTRPLDRAEPPPTVTALLTSRLDRLPAGERDLLERVSVIGLEFTPAQAELLVEPQSRPEVAGLLSALTRRDLVRSDQSSQGVTCAFKHVLVRDAAYEGMAKSLRSELHERFAEAVAAGDDGGDEQTGFVAHHLEKAARYRRELTGHDPETETLVDRAVEALLVAAEQARDRVRYEDHAAYLERALGLEPGASQVRRRILAQLAEHDDDVMDADHLAEVLDAFEAELDDTAGAMDRAYLRMMRRYREMFMGSAIDPAEVSEAAQALASLGQSAADTTSVVRGLRVVSICSAMLGLWRDAAAISNEIIRIGSPGQAQDARALQHAAILLGEGTVSEHRDVVHHEYEISGYSDRWGLAAMYADALLAAAECSPDMHEALRAAVARGDELYEAGKLAEQTGAQLIDGFAMSRDLDSAISYAQRVNDNFRQTGALGYAATYTLQQVLLMLERGDSAGTVLPLIEEAASYTSPYDAISVAYTSACRAILAVRTGDHVSATRLAAESLRVVDETHQLWQRADLRFWLSEVPRASGDEVLERRMLEEASAMYERKEIRSYDAEIGARLAELAVEQA
jgi:class 3 adenylate cyclase